MTVSYTKRRKRVVARKQQGMAAIEFALGFFAFWSMCVMFVEMSYISYVSALGDVMITEASHQAKLNQGDDFIDVFDSVIEQQDSIWKSVVERDAFTTNITYVQSVDGLACVENNRGTPQEQQCVQDNGDSSSPIAIYSLGYSYSPIFSLFLGNADDVFSREAIVIQEYKRGKP